MIPIASPQFGLEERERLDEVLNDGHVADGPEVRRFESEFTEYCDADHGVATSNGTTALHAALHALGVGEGDRVLTTPFTYIATANAITHVGADLGLVDIDPRTYNLDPDRLEARLRAGERVDAVIVVHLYGLPAAMDRFTTLADEYDFHLVEDAAQAHGATFDGERVGAIGDVGTFSFYPTKNMTTGEGGMLVTNNEGVARRARRFIDHGRASDLEHQHDVPGHNFRMSSLNAAVGRVQLDRVSEYTQERRRNAARLTERLRETPLVTPEEPSDRTHVYHQYTVRVKGPGLGRDRFKDALADRNVGSKVYYRTPVHWQRAYDHMEVEAPASEQSAEEVLSLPVHPGVSPADVERVADAAVDAVEETVGGEA